MESASAFQAKPNSWEFAQYTMIAKDGSKKKLDPWKAEFRTDAPWTYLQGLQISLFALAKAGATFVRPARITTANWPSRLDGQQESPNVGFQDVIDYLAKLQNFVILYSVRKSTQQVWLTLRSLDETTRKTWCDMYRKNLPLGISFSQCMEFAKPWLDLQLQNLELDQARSGDGTPNRPGGRGDRDRDRSRQHSPLPRRPTHPKEPEYKEVKAKCGSHQIWVGTTKRVKGKTLEICKDYNLKGKCPRVSDCKWENCCDVIPKGQRAVCGSTTHTRQEHNSVSLWYA